MSSAKNHKMRSHRSERIKRSIIGSSARKTYLDMSGSVRHMNLIRKLMRKIGIGLGEEY